mmetsp:Transcript_13088/g.19293  ORF Transcript_13088/g.19293 Transcript_13088/m.19293 type:complete len:89 (+) Transcript_13088:101-367(+)|eukprot:CAMPEP_0194026842 /NCGR_PEP_ID=MMETSP0009_2-20130614/1103_1 /TAXON_ID=210454 /ORGANISM="Grammatophora oceanica, Strain CCMP 410" /LENGTH=88 /DNA_ID=CAMNT_0038665711 /DNA_START=97 /DNA_END=363 /DNA_ORIENTATION=-
MGNDVSSKLAQKKAEGFFKDVKKEVGLARDTEGQTADGKPAKDFNKMHQEREANFIEADREKKQRVSSAKERWEKSRKEKEARQKGKK